MSVTGYLTDEYTSWPLRLNVSNDLDLERKELLLDAEEAEEYIVLLEQLLAELSERDNRRVRVSFSNSASPGILYTYRDPSGELEVGDHVLVPTRLKPENVATVKEIGDGGYEGHVSDVIAKLERVEL